MLNYSVAELRIEKIMSKLGMVVLWCIVIIYGIGVITHICSDIIGVVVLVILAVISIIFVLYAKKIQNMVQEASQDA